MDANAKDLIKRLLSRDVTSRLGSLKVRERGREGGRERGFSGLQQGVADVKQHRWFRGVDWDAVLQRKLVVSGQSPRVSPSFPSSFQPGIIPKAIHPGDTRNFEQYPEDGWFNVPALKDSDIIPFKDF